MTITRLVVSGGEDATIKVWDATTGECLRVFTGHERCINAVSITPDGRLVVSGGEDATIKVWDVTTGKCSQVFEKHKQHIKAISMDGRLAISGDWDRTLKIFDLVTNERLKVLKEQKVFVKAVSITPDNRLMMSGNLEHSLKIWDIAKGECVQTFTGHTNIIDSISIAPDGQLAVSSSFDGYYIIWNIISGECLEVLEKINQDENIFFTSDGKWVHDNKGNILILGRLGSRKVIDKSKLGFGRTAVAPDGRLAISENGYEISVWDTIEKKRLRFGLHSSCIEKATFCCGLLNVFEISGAITCFDISILISTPILTPARLYLHAKSVWDSDITALCFWCGERFPVPRKMLDDIKGISGYLSPDQSPCLELPDEAFENSRLLSQCPSCQKPLKFNPFIVDNKERFP